MQTKQIDMKNLSKTTLFFSGKSLLCAALIAGAAFTSCTKTDNSPSAVTEDDAAEVVTEAVVPNSAGLAVQAQGAVTVSSNTYYSTLCGTAKDTAVSGSGSVGSAISWNYNFNWHWSLDCTAQEFDLTFRGLVNYTGPIITSADSSIATYAVTGLGAPSQWMVNVNYTRYGNKQFTNGRQLAFASQLTFTSTNIVIDKSTQKIVSGTAAVQLIGTDNAGKSFSYSGTLTFNGNNTGTFTFSSGHTVNITW